ncbi:MAG: hypothetical protein AB1566_08640 [Chloroflexota bacterium]
MFQDTAPSCLLVASLCELGERLSQLELFVAEPSVRARAENEGLIVALLAAVDHLVQRLDRQVIAPLRKPLQDGSLEDQACAQALEEVQRFALAFQKAHQNLAFLTGHGSHAVTYTFVHKLLNEARTKALPAPDICLGNEYDFFRHDLRKTLVAPLEALGTASRLPEWGLSLLLPKAEAGNPLMWTMLAHQIGHYIVDHFKVAHHIRADLPIRTGTSPQSDDALLRYAEELAADLLAQRLAGPAYFLSLASLGLLFRPGGPLGLGVPLGLRLGHLRRHLKPLEALDGQGLRRTANVELFSSLDALSLAERLVSECHRLSAPSEPSGLSSSEQDPSVALENYDCLDAIIARQRVAPAAIPSPEDFHALFARMCSGIPINSLCPTLSRETIKRLEGAATPTEFYHLLGDIRERPTTLAHILLVGWTYKLLRSYQIFRELLLSAATLREALAAYAGHLRNRQALLQKSIETSFIQQTYNRWRGEAHGA